MTMLELLQRLEAAGSDTVVFETEEDKKNLADLAATMAPLFPEIAGMADTEGKAAVLRQHVLGSRRVTIRRSTYPDGWIWRYED